jgi:hypothetical protein
MLEILKGAVTDGVMKIGEDNRRMTDGVMRDRSGSSGVFTTE